MRNQRSATCRRRPVPTAQPRLGYTALATSLGGSTAYDASSVATSALGVNGTLAVVVAGVDFTFAGGPGSATALPTLNITYDEA
jgi:hypothetical protein